MTQLLRNNIEPREGPITVIISGYPDDCVIWMMMSYGVVSYHKIMLCASGCFISLRILVYRHQVVHSVLNCSCNIFV